MDGIDQQGDWGQSQWEGHRHLRGCHICKIDGISWYLIGERESQGHPHDPGSVQSPRNDTLMTLTLRQVTQFLWHNWPTNMQQLNIYRSLWNCVMTLYIERRCVIPQTNTIKTMCHSWKPPWPLPLRLTWECCWSSRCVGVLQSSKWCVACHGSIQIVGRGKIKLKED
jgi:hypothetical protein